MVKLKIRCLKKLEEKKWLHVIGNMKNIVQFNTEYY